MGCLLWVQKVLYVNNHGPAFNIVIYWSVFQRHLGVLGIPPSKHYHGPLTRYVKFRVAHASEMPGTFSPPPRVSDPDLHHGTCMTHVPWRMLGSLTSGFFWSRWWGKRSRHSLRMRNPQFYVSGKGPMDWTTKHMQLSILQTLCILLCCASFCFGCVINCHLFMHLMDY